MKKRLRIVRYVLLGTLICTAVFKVYLKSDMIFNDVETTTRNQEYKDNFGSYYINLTPDKLVVADSLFDEKTGRWMLARIKEVSVYIPEEEKTKPSMVSVFMNGAYAILILGSFGMIVFNSIFIMNSVERAVVFAWINVRRLRLISLGLFIVFILDTINSIYNNFIVKDLIKISDYSTIMEPFSSIGLLLGGVIAFIAAEIFAVGLRLKEEQELTI